MGVGGCGLQQAQGLALNQLGPWQGVKSPFDNESRDALGHQVWGGAFEQGGIGQGDDPLGATALAFGLARVYEDHQGLAVEFVCREAPQFGQLPQGTGLQFHGFVDQQEGTAGQDGGVEWHGLVDGQVIDDGTHRDGHEGFALGKSVLLARVVAEIVFPILSIVSTEIIGVINGQLTWARRCWGKVRWSLARPWGLGAGGHREGP